MSDLIITPAGTTIENTPIITLNQDQSILMTDPIGRQTIVSLSTPQLSPVTPISYTLSQPYLYNLPPLISSTYEYQDINADSDLHQKVMKKIYTNFYNFIIPNQFPHLLNYIKNQKGNYTVVKKMQEYKKNKTRENEYEPKLQYIARNVYTKPDMYRDVKNYLETYEIKWYEIEDKKKDVYELLVKKLKNKLDNLID
jgi:hypothetical protein